MLRYGGSLKYHLPLLEKRERNDKTHKLKEKYEEGREGDEITKGIMERKKGRGMKIGLK
jgi:hypothetical protein